MELQLVVTFFSGEEKDKIFKVEINAINKETRMWCPDCFTPLTKQDRYVCKNCKYEIADEIFENAKNI
jgi:hypothetical protein